MKIFGSKWFPVCFGAIIILVIINDNFISNKSTAPYKRHIRPFFYEDSLWQPPDENDITDNAQKQLVLYGKELIAHTSYYLGPKGKIAAITNGMNCQNCHVNAGCDNYSNCFSAVASTYPKFRDRSGKIESIQFRINECMERSLNGKPLDSNSREMKAMLAYLQWLGTDVPKGVIPKGSGTEVLKFMDRAADPDKGKIVFESKCVRCHGADGQGLMNIDSSGYIYPPLWGDHSYNISAGLYRLSRFAGYVKNTMPYGTTYLAPQLTNEEAWDVAAFVNSQPRPQKIFSYDWPSIVNKPVDYPFGPYADAFSETQHKYGPFKPIADARTMAKK